MYYSYYRDVDFVEAPCGYFKPTRSRYIKNKILRRRKRNGK